MRTQGPRLILLFLFACLARPASAYQCASPEPTPAWDAAVEAHERLEKARLIDDDAKAPLLEQFDEMKRVSDSIDDGTHPLCQAWESYSGDVDQYERDVAEFTTDANAYNAVCTTVPDEDARQACLARLGPLQARKSNLDGRKAGLDSRKADLDQQTSDLNGENHQKWQDFTAAADELMTSLPESAGTLVAAMDGAARAVDPGNPPNLSPEKAELNCNRFFRAVGAGLSGTSSPEWSDQTLNANQIAQRIAANTGEWTDVSGESETDLQKRANRGEVVVGVYTNPRGHGHLAVVMPVPPGLDFSDYPGSGPFVRDGNVHHTKPSSRHPHQIAPLGRGAARASYAFGNDRRWYVWIPSEP